MEILLCILTGLLGGICGFLAGRFSTDVRPEALPRIYRTADTPLLRQYHNFLVYDGTGKGQTNIEIEE